LDNTQPKSNKLLNNYTQLYKTLPTLFTKFYKAWHISTFSKFDTITHNSRKLYTILQNLYKLNKTIHNFIKPLQQLDNTLKNTKTHALQNFTQVHKSWQYSTELYTNLHNYTQLYKICTQLLQSFTKLYTTLPKKNLQKFTTFYNNFFLKTKHTTIHNFLKLYKTLQSFFKTLHKKLLQTKTHTTTLQNYTKPYKTLFDVEQNKLYKHFTNLNKTLQHFTQLYNNYTTLEKLCKTLQNSTKLYETLQQLYNNYTQLCTTIRNSTKLYKTIQSFSFFNKTSFQFSTKLYTTFA